MAGKRKNQSFVTQAAVLATAGLLVRIIGFGYRVPITRMIGDKGNAIYSAGYNLYNFFLILSSAGLPAAISKMVSSRIALGQYKNAHQIFKVSMIFATITGLLGAMILYLGAEVYSAKIGVPEAYYSILTLAPTVFIVAIMSVYRGYFQGMNNMAPTAFSQILEQLFNAGFSIYLVSIFYETSTAYAAAGGTAATGIGAFMGLMFIMGIYALAKPRIYKKMRKQGGIGVPESNKALAKELLFTAFPVIAGSAIFSLTTLIDTQMVMSRLMENGAHSYEQAEAFFGQLSGKYVTITNVPTGIAASMATAVIPSIAASVAIKDYQSANEKINLAIRLAMFITIPAAFGLAVYADQILTFLFSSYNEGGNLLRAGSISIIFFALSSISTGVLQGIGRLRIPVFAAFLGCLIKIPVNYYLIAVPSVNIIGAIIGTTVCYMVSAGINTFFAFRFTGSRVQISRIFIKPFISAVIMAMVCYIAYYTIYYIYPSNALALIVGIMVGVCVYFLMMLIIQGITEEDLKNLPMGGKIHRAARYLGLM